MNIDKIHIENFKSFYEPVDFDFREMKGLWRIAGPVGVGKTTIGEAVLYGLFGGVNGKNNGDLISWGRKHGLVELWCHTSSHSLYIRREINSYGQSPTYVEVDGEEMKAPSKKDIQSTLEKEYYDISRMTVELLCIVSFNNFKSLSTLSSKDTKLFMDKVLGFYTLSQYIDACKELRNENQRAIASLDGEINKISAQINKIEEIGRMRVIEGDEKEVGGIIKECEERLNELKADYEKKAGEIQKEIGEERRKLGGVESEGRIISKDIAFMEKGVCPTCGAPIDQSALPAKRTELSRLREQYKEISSHIKTLEDSIRLLKDVLVKDGTPINDKIKESRTLLVSLREQAQRMKINNSEINSLRSKIEGIASQKSLASLDDAQWNTLYNTLEYDVKNHIINSFIPLLNKNIMDYSQSLRQPYIVKFNSDFDCIVNKYGIDQTIPLSSLSTGQLKIVNMCIIFGMLKTIINTNRLNVVILDELFSNLNSALCNEMCELLRGSLRPDDSIFIISHTSVDDKYFDGIIDVSIRMEDKYENHSEIGIEKKKCYYTPISQYKDRSSSLDDLM